MRNIILLIMILASYSLHAKNSYEIRGASLAPNYLNRADGFDFAVLSDGRTTNRSMWKSSNAATWVKPVPVMLQIDIDKMEIGKLKNTGTSIDFHFGNREAVGVHLPLRIDAYDNLSGNKLYRHIGEWQRGGTGYSATGGWITVDMNYLPEHITVVIHAGGKVISMDELVFRKNRKLSNGSEWSVGIKLNPIEDSFEKLKKYQDQRLEKSGNKVPLLKVMMPFYDLMGSEERHEAVTINNFFLEGPHSYITIMAEGFPDKTCLKIEVDEHLEVYQLTHVYSVKGKRVYDVLTPYKACLFTEVGHPSYIMLKSKRKNFSNSVKAGYVKIFDGEGKLHFSKAVEHKLQNKTERLVKDCINVAPYSYSNEYPAWNNKQKMFQQLYEAGVNTFFIPPKNFPFVDDVGSLRRSEIALQRFRKELELYSAAKNIIFVARLDKKVDWSLPRKKVEEKLVNWIDLIEKEIESAGYHFRFFIQPIDEAHNTDWEKVFLFAKILKEKRKTKIGLYLNPIYKKNDPQRSVYLNRLKKYVDVWQPNLKFLRRVPRSEYLSDHSELWFYHNPSYPPKEAAPSYYADLVKIAIHEKLNGVGFWSVTSTKKSSPWYDWDGVQPDYGVFYEKDGELYPSLRWLAFVSKINAPCTSQF